MDNKIVNKQISVAQIIKIANRLEMYKKEYDEKFEAEEDKNRDLPYSEKNYEWESGSSKLQYTVDRKEGKSLTETSYDWFVSSFDTKEEIKSVNITFSVSFYTKADGAKDNSVRNSIRVDLYFNENSAKLSVDATNQENEANKLHGELLKVLEENDNKFNKTIKRKKIRMQSFCVSVGLILSYALFLVLKLTESNLPEEIIKFLNNKYVLLIGQWPIALLLGNLFGFWIIESIYKPLMPEMKYSGYNSQTYKSIYKDDVEEYMKSSEVHFGKYSDAEMRRNKIEKIFKTTTKIILLQILISILLYFVL